MLVGKRFDAVKLEKEKMIELPSAISFNDKRSTESPHANNVL